MKYARAYAALILATAFLASCATRPPAQERPNLVQLSVAYSDGPCDWSLMQDVNNPPATSGALGAAYWPHTVPVASRSRPSRSAPLLAYGTDTSFSWPSQPNERLCLTLHKRASVWQEGVPPVVTLEMFQGPAEAEVHALTSSSSLSSAVVMLKSVHPGPDLAPRRMDLALREGRAEGRFAPPLNGQWLGVTVVVTEAGGEGQTERALELLTTAGVEENLIVREGSRLVARPSWPAAGRRSSQPR
ncbi:hypothetical protein D3C71_319340 [compost metagenome]|jgi:hypothetical protein